MCEYCHGVVHQPGCPNEEIRKTGITCDECGEELEEGTEFWDIDGQILCDECASAMSWEELMEFVGRPWDLVLEDLGFALREAKVPVHED